MPFIGNQPALSYTSFAKQDFTTSATTSYTLDHPVTNENEIALFINFVRQEPGTAYSASNTTLTLTSATSASDDMYCVFLGKAVQTVNPPNGSVGLSQLSATGTKDSTTFLRGDNTFDTPPLGGITEADQWKLTSNLQLTSNDINANLSRVNKIGTGMTESSGIFTFPSTGIYMITVNASFHSTSGAGSSRYVMVRTKTTTNNSTYNNVARAITNIYNFQAADISTNASSILYFDVTDTSTHKVKFSANSATPSGYYLDGTSSDTYTNFNFIRLGDT